MPNIILKNPDGHIAYRFFYGAREGICYQRGGAGDYEILSPDATNDFDAVLDQNGAVHLVCKEKSRNVLYYTYFQEQWYKTNLLVYREEASSRVEGFRIAKRGNVLNIFYILYYERQRLLIRQTIGGGDDSPSVVRVLEGTSFDVTDEMLVSVKRKEPSAAEEGHAKSINEEALEWYAEIANSVKGKEQRVESAEGEQPQATPAKKKPKSRSAAPKQASIKQLEQKIEQLTVEVARLRRRSRGGRRRKR